MENEELYKLLREFKDGKIGINKAKDEILLLFSVSSSVSVPAVRVRFYPKDVDETFDGTVIEETQYSYLVIPDDNLTGTATGTARWNKKCCDVLR